MEPLFSHAPRTEPEEPARGEAPPSDVYVVEVPAPREVVYAVFAGDIHLWWPAGLTVFGEGTHPFIEDGIIGEEGESGETATWGEVVREEPGEALEFSWSLGSGAGSPTRVRVELEDAGDAASPRTRLTLVQDGRAPGRDGTEEAGAGDAWATALGRLAAFFGVSAGAVRRLQPGRD